MEVKEGRFAAASCKTFFCDLEEVCLHPHKDLDDGDVALTACFNSSKVSSVSEISSSKSFLDGISLLFQKALHQCISSSPYSHFE